MAEQHILILGINGNIGRYAALAFQAAGYRVTGFGRTNRRPLPDIGFVAGDAGDAAALRAALAPADIVLNGLNLPYHQWDKGRAEAQLSTVIEAMAANGKTLLHPGNIYNYAADQRRITPQTEQRPQTARGAIRQRQEQMLAAASGAGRFQTIIIRAGDFYAPDQSNGWFEQAMLLNAEKGKLHLMGAPDIGHAWAYLPDLGAAFVTVAAQRHTLAAFEQFHFAGHYRTHGQMQSAIAAAAPLPLKPSLLAWRMLGIAGLVNPLLREIVKMRYLWSSSMELVDPRLDALLGEGFGTPFAEAVAETVKPLLAPSRRR